MTLAIYTSAAWTANGGITVAAGATVEVRRESDGVLASIFSDRAGSTLKDNPFTADAQGRFSFFAAGGAYRVKVTDAEGSSHTLEYQAVGTAGEADLAANGGTVAQVDQGETITGLYDFTQMPEQDGNPIVESGSNSDGEWVRFADGTQIAFDRISGPYPKSITWPVAFSEQPVVFGSPQQSDTNDVHASKFTSVTSSGASAALVFFSGDGDPAYSSLDMSFKALGRWY